MLICQLVEQVAHQRYFHGPFTVAELDAIMWNETSYPFDEDELVLRRQLEAFFDFMATPAPPGTVNGGRSRCPWCGRRWWVTPVDGCLLPACGCAGSDTTADNPYRPCHACGLDHALNCTQPRPKVRG